MTKDTRTDIQIYSAIAMICMAVIRTESLLFEAPITISMTFLRDVFFAIFVV